MKETDLNYGVFSKPKKNLSDKNEDQLEQNVQVLNAHFQNSCEEKKEKSEKEEAVSIVASIEPEDAVTIDVSETKKQAEKNSSHNKYKKTFIGVKLIAIISTLVVISMGLITFLVSYYVTKDTRANAETTNFTLNSRTASDAENRINSVVSNVSLFCDVFVFSYN